jgi:AcrR family transcriptional regulator
MPTLTSRPGGRPPLITLDDVIAIGRDLGMRRLSINAVAARLGVTATALYRHVGSRWELERLVGESLLAELDLRDDPDADTEQHLLSFALQLQDFCAEHPGLASYLQVLFPRGYAGRQLVAAELEAISRRGYFGDTAVLLASVVATLVISLAAREESNAGATGGEHATGFVAERDAVDDRLTADPQLGAAHIGATQVSNSEFVRLLLAASIRGLVAEIPPGRQVGEVVAALSAARRDG